MYNTLRHELLEDITQASFSNKHMSPAASLGSSFAERFRDQSKDMPVDVVLLWVDGADPLWQKKKAQYKGNAFSSYVKHDAPSRYRSWNMIDYCLECILLNVRWVRQIFLVTDNQIPANLSAIQAVNPAIPINVIDHRQIIADEYLPTFNSFSIMSFLHKIPNLSEVFLYLNDDTFLFGQTKRNEFLSDSGNLLVSRHWNDPNEESLKTLRDHFMQWALDLKLKTKRKLNYVAFGLRKSFVHYFLTLDNTEKLTSKFCKERGVRRLYLPPHFPTLYLKSGFQYAQDHFPRQIHRTRSNRLRSLGDICVQTIALNYAYSLGLVELQQTREIFIGMTRELNKVREALAISYNHDVVCINDDIEDDGPIESEITTMLDDYFKKRVNTVRDFYAV